MRVWGGGDNVHPIFIIKAIEKVNFWKEKKLHGEIKPNFGLVPLDTPENSMF